MENTSVSGMIAMTAGVVSAFLSNNTVRAAELPDLIATVHASLQAVVLQPAGEEQLVELKPAVPVKKSITKDYLICLDDGKKFRSMRRHLAALGMTPDEYRTKWDLPRDYPMVAPNYAAARSALAKSMGLGTRRAATAAVATIPAPAEDAEAPPAARRARRTAKAV